MKPGTIFALASAPGRAGVAVVRVSGADAGTALARLAGEGAGYRAAPRQARLTRFVDPATGEAIDDGLALWFPGPASFTGEDVAELHLHGGPAVVAATLAALGRIDGLRLAEPGEFTRRAFELGKLDLTAAEGLADLVAAETAAQRRQALRQLDGDLGRLYEGWRASLLAAVAHWEAGIDFSDQDLPGDVEAGARDGLARVRDAVAAHLADGGRGERLRDGLRVAIIGPPNAGKSSLLNRLAGREAAIVHADAGTTRDVIEVHMDLGGYPLTVADTAGLRDGGGDVEAEGIRRAEARAAEADLRLAVFDGATWPDVDARTASLVDGDTVLAVNKSDLGTLPADADALAVAGQPALALSALTGDGLAALEAALAARVRGRLETAAGDAPALTRARHREALQECLAALDRFAAGDAAAAAAPELAAEDLRLAARALGRITGRVDVEDVLDVIFRDFCIGK